MNDLDQQIRRWAEQRPSLRHSSNDTHRIVAAVRRVEPAAVRDPVLAWRLGLAAAAAVLLAFALWPARKAPPAPAQVTVALTVPCGQPRPVLPSDADVVLVKLDRYPGLFDRPADFRETL